ncbi:unnamed protein product [Nezara viridula]|uniref:Uncharacterized protein n=1 Tax=Nezara viridula TaxID=85310 RepID=A0A9P0HH14_NEZVI|nr:unnamed protein product [Nezara viridula]
MLLLAGLLLSAPAALACGGSFFGCFKSDLLQAFSKIAASDSYVLVPGLSFDRKKDVPRSLQAFPVGAGDVSVVDVYRNAERLFKSHSLFWNVLPGVDISVSEGKDGNFVLGVERCHHESGPPSRDCLPEPWAAPIVGGISTPLYYLPFFEIMEKAGPASPPCLAPLCPTKLFSDIPVPATAPVRIRLEWKEIAEFTFTGNGISTHVF